MHVLWAITKRGYSALRDPGLEQGTETYLSRVGSVLLRYCQLEM